MAAVDKLLKFLKQAGGSDLHLAAGLVPRVRMHGSLQSLANTRPLTDEELRGLMREIVTEVQWHHFERGDDVDFSYGLAGVARYRGNYFHQVRGVGAVFRTIPEKIVSLDDLGLPPAVERFAHLKSGLVLVTGPTGSGKSTTLAAIIDRINETYAKHILTIEDPIEFVHKNKRSILSQREVGTHTRSFEAALRAGIRQDPDVILVGELRGGEIELALTAAEMGMLVFGTLHTNSASKTIDRLVDAFPADEQPQIRMSLADTLQGVVAQILVPTADGKGRCAVNEILVKTSALPNIIREHNTSQLTSFIQGGKSQGMQAMDDALAELVQKGRITQRDAYMKALDKTRFDNPRQPNAMEP
jgi:twitching motility protein PilT